MPAKLAPASRFRIASGSRSRCCEKRKLGRREERNIRFVKRHHNREGPSLLLPTSIFDEKFVGHIMELQQAKGSATRTRSSNKPPSKSRRWFSTPVRALRCYGCALAILGLLGFLTPTGAIWAFVCGCLLTCCDTEHTDASMRNQVHCARQCAIIGIIFSLLTIVGRSSNRTLALAHADVPLPLDRNTSVVAASGSAVYDGVRLRAGGWVILCRSL